MICRSRGLLVADLRPPIQRRRGLFLANLPTTCHLADRPPPRRPLPRRSAATENPPCRAAAIDSSLDDRNELLLMILLIEVQSA
uniref:Uncharacterized protein n=1 Tax=Leersia perrieri TaxID=77586 RepID=A0A0D9XIR4_9ORYZ